ncbi:molybdopterin-dependent oxidoreductase [Kutzneria buriramensis]|uniref:DMSO/TMAO reductase YedYZ molybdopterin-dependent catalytic subunit n=1 Tax=Kutzneria buriramensis TaxID=1045776 RepID=A0A3E0GXT6_9PSEU|nr:molybdopterin-dependent oxidoreductase [Kutzneria buriramensis]REH33044.1 DMSO/TMAO reductase YedYZ molybdopterin-dependent catalytic subunit [Kutzneria buriramensis]
MEQRSLVTSVAVGVLGVGAALAAGDLVAAFVDADASPFLAVGNTAIDLTPLPLKDFAVRTFGTYDKVVLLSGMGAFLLVAAAIAGVLSRRRPLPGTVLAVLLGLLGVAAVLGRPNFTPLGVLAPVASLIVGVTVFRWLHRLSGTVDTVDGPGRRRFLLGSLGALAGIAVAGVGGRLLVGRVDVAGSRDKVTRMFAGRVPPRIPDGADFARDGTPSFLTPNPQFYRVDTALAVPQLRAEDWSLRVHGLVDRELHLTFADVMAMDLVTRTITMTCVSNEVGGPYVSTANFTGVLLRDLLARAGVRPEADQVLSSSVDGYSAGSPVVDVLDPRRDAMLAVGMNGEALPPEHGFPARLVVPGIYGYASATKWVHDIELTTFAAKRQYWVPRGYSERAPIKTESRIDVPQGLQALPNGKVVVAGIAWAQTRGIAKVEVRMDGGPWQEADLAAGVSAETWRMWRKEYDLKPGTHTVICRATDTTGYTQTTGRVGPIPDGATGLHTIVFTTA